MTYKGHIQNGVVVLDEPTPFTDGTVVEIALARAALAPEASDAEPLSIRLAAIIGKATDLPEDWASNHDKYIRDNP